jgi:hypothetical protein
VISPVIANDDNALQCRYEDLGLVRSVGPVAGAARSSEIRLCGRRGHWQVHLASARSLVGEFANVCAYFWLDHSPLHRLVETYSAPDASVVIRPDSVN